MAKGSQNPWVQGLLVGGLYVLLYLVFIGESHLLRIIAAEKALNEAFFSSPVATQLESRGVGWYQTAVVDTEIVAHSFAMYLPTEAEKARAAETAELGGYIFDWFEQRLRAWWTVVWIIFVRLSVVLVWAPYALIFVLPWLVDGWVEREKRKYTFEFSSPVKHRYTMMAIAAIPVVFVLGLTLPFPMNPILAPICLILFGYLSYLAAANFMKRA